MKLALIRRHFAATGGAELYLQRLLGALVQQGHEPHLFAQSWSAPPDGVSLHPIPVTGTRAQRPVRFAHAVREELARDGFDCVFSLERTLRQDVYRAGDGVHRVWLQRRRQFAPWWKRPFVGFGAFHRALLRLEAQTFDPANTRRVIVNSEMVRHEILDHFKFPAERIHLIRNGVAVARFQSGRRAETRARFGVTDDEFLLLFVGSGWARKGLKYLLRAMSMLPSTGVKLLVVGKGRKPPGAPANVIFAGAMAGVEDAYAAADLFAFLPIYEPAANVVVEALAAELPVLTSAQNGASELIQPGVNGSIVADPSDTNAVSAELEQWRRRGKLRVTADVGALGLERNVAETLAILELAARERAG